MPRKQRQSRQNLVEQEGGLQLAIQALKQHEIQSIRRAAEVYNVPRSTLQDRLSGHISQPELRNHMHRLTKTQESALISMDYIQRYTWSRPKAIACTANGRYNPSRRISNTFSTN
jgi:hypothetical protein